MKTARFDGSEVVAGPLWPARQRIDFIDHLRGLGIVMVVVGHVLTTPEALRTLIYSVHMPLFFFISGYLLSPTRALEPWSQTWRRCTRALLVPYVVFFVLSLAYWLVTRNIGSRAAKFSGLGVGDAWWGLATGLSSDLFVNVTLWFLPCMFCCQLIYALARRWQEAHALTLLLLGGALLLLALTLPWSQRLPWGLDIVWIALVFFAVGHSLRVSGALERTPAMRPPLRPPVRPLMHAMMPLLMHPLMPLLAAGAWLLLVQMQGRSDLAAANFGAEAWLYIPCALLGLAFLVPVARLLPPMRSLSVLGENSLAIFALHPLFINFASGVVKLGGLQPLADAHPLTLALLNTAWGLLGSLAVALLIKRHAPMLLGQRARSGSRP